MTVHPHTFDCAPEDLPTLRAFLSAFAPPPKVRASMWAEAHIELPADTNAEPGPLKLAPYQAQMIDLVDLPTTIEAVFMMGAQTGKSTTINCIMLNRIKTHPGPMLHLSADEKQSRVYVRQSLDPLVAASPKLAGTFGDGRRGGSGDSTEEKKFSGGFLAFGSAFKSTDLRGRSFRDVYFDEIDAYPKNVQGEGDPIELGKKRQLMFKGRRKTLLASTPTYYPSPIAAQFERGTQHRFFIECPDCDHADFIRFENLKWTSGKPYTARLECSACGYRMDEAERRRALDGGTWRATVEPKEPGVLSFHATALISYFCDMAEVAQKYEEVEGKPHGMKTFRNTWLAEVWTPEGTELPFDALWERRERIVSPYPAIITDIVAAVDVQKDRVECTYLATADGEEQAVLDHVIIQGESIGPRVWNELDVELGRTFKLVDGRTLPVAITAVDSGWNTDAVYDFVKAQRRKGRRCYPIKGSKVFDAPILARGYAHIGKPTVYHVGVSMLKEQIYKRLVSKAAGPYGLHIPDHLDISYYEQLASERLVIKHTPRGTVSRWEKLTPSTRNEALDVLTYALAIRTKLKYADNGSNVYTLADRVARVSELTNS